MTKEELIKYHEETLECLTNMENSDCNYNCENCHIEDGVGEHEITRETINHLNNCIEFSLKEKEMLVNLIEKEITVMQWCRRSSREIQELTDLKEKIKMLIK